MTFIYLLDEIEIIEEIRNEMQIESVVGSLGV